MKKFKLEYLYYIFIIIFLYLSLLILFKLINTYTIIIALIILIISYNINKKVFKKIIYKIIYKDKKKRLSFKGKFNAAKISLDSIEEITNKINDNLKVRLLNYEKDKLQSQLNFGDYKVILFGASSSGKTSIARVLLNSIIGKTSPTLGTTKELTSYKIKIPILKRNINIIDTPGLFEPSDQGHERERKTILQASESDLILFVLDQDINKYESYLIDKFSNIGKKLIIVLNKCDLRKAEENNIIQKNIKTITSSSKNNIVVVKTTAISFQESNRNSALEGKLNNHFPDVSNLFKEIIKTLDNNGEELLADNILFRLDKLGLKSKNFVLEQRFLLADKVIKKYMWVTGGLIMVNPLPAIDFLTTTSVIIQLILELSKIYEFKITKSEAKELSKSLVGAIAKLGILKGALAIISSTLASNFTTLFVSKSIQSVTAGWLIKIIGLSLIEYFKNGQNWGDDGIQEVVNRIYKINKRKELLNNFVNEAISKIELEKSKKSQKTFPSFFN